MSEAEYEDEKYPGRPYTWEDHQQWRQRRAWLGLDWQYRDEEEPSATEDEDAIEDLLEGKFPWRPKRRRLQEEWYFERRERWAGSQYFGDGDLKPAGWNH